MTAVRRETEPGEDAIRSYIDLLILCSQHEKNLDNLIERLRKVSEAMNEDDLFTRGFDGSGGGKVVKLEMWPPKPSRDSPLTEIPPDHSCSRRR